MNTPTLGAHCANPQPNHTAEGSAHDAIHPLDSAPLPQRRPWAILSGRAALAVWMSAVAATVSILIYADLASRGASTLAQWIVWLGVVWLVLFAGYLIAAVIIVICTDASAEANGGPDADSAR